MLSNLSEALLVKKLGYAIISVGFLAGAFTSVIDKDSVPWRYFAGSFAVGVIGIVLVRATHARHGLAEGKLISGMQAIEMSLTRIVENITELNAQKQSVDTYDIRHRIDELFIEDLNTFIQARESIAQVHGLAAYADVMSCFSAGERYLNRVWSASADGYVDEVNAYLDKAQKQFVEGIEKFHRLGRNNEV